MLHVHHAEDGGPIISDGDLTIRADQHLVHAIRAKGGAEDISHSPCSKDVRLGRAREGEGGLVDHVVVLCKPTYLMSLYSLKTCLSALIP